MFFRRRNIAFLLCTVALVISRAFAHPSESLRIPNSGDSCNVVNLNFGGAEGNTEQARGPQGPPGKRGSPGSGGIKGDKGVKGEIGPRGIEPEIDLPRLKTSVLKALSASSCDELKQIHRISDTGYYLMMSNESSHPVYKYCDFEVRDGVETCEELWVNTDGENVTGYYLLGDRNIFVYCHYYPRNDYPRNEYPRNCNAVQRRQAKLSNVSGGVFDIFPEAEESGVEVYCDLETDGGGWTVFQRRMDGSVDFFRGWNDYVSGFGRKDGEFWLGLENIYQLTKDGNYELRVDLMDFSHNKAYAKYQNFSITSRDDNYRLSVGGYSGTAGDSLTLPNGMEFSTKDADHDQWSNNCAVNNNNGAWWYNACSHSNLNGLYNQSPGSGYSGVVWYYWKRTTEYLKFTEMKFKKKE